MTPKPASLSVNPCVLFEPSLAFFLLVICGFINIHPVTFFLSFILFHILLSLCPFIVMPSEGLSLVTQGGVGAFSAVSLSSLAILLSSEHHFYYIIMVSLYAII